jgi:dCTP deaminase
MILPAQLIKAIEPPVVQPFRARTVDAASGMTYGLGPAGYDVRIAEHILLRRGAFALASTIEKFEMPHYVLATVHDKSSWARKGLAVQTTVIEPGWRGYLTLELTNHGPEELLIEHGSPIAQILFHQLVEPTSIPYRGRYQDQMAGPQPAIRAKAGDL